MTPRAWVDIITRLALSGMCSMWRGLFFFHTRLITDVILWLILCFRPSIPKFVVHITYCMTKLSKDNAHSTCSSTSF